MTTSEDTITITESEAYRLRTVLNYLLKGQNMSVNGIEGRLNGSNIVIRMEK